MPRQAIIFRFLGNYVRIRVAAGGFGKELHARIFNFAVNDIRCRQKSEFDVFASERLVSFLAFLRGGDFHQAGGGVLSAAGKPTLCQRAALSPKKCLSGIQPAR